MGVDGGWGKMDTCSHLEMGNLGIKSRTTKTKEPSTYLHVSLPRSAWRPVKVRENKPIMSTVLLYSD